MPQKGYFSYLLTLSKIALTTLIKCAHAFIRVGTAKGKQVILFLLLADRKNIENFGNIKDILCQEKNHQVENELVTVKVLAWRIPKTSAHEFKCSFFQTEKRQEICLKPPKAQRKGFKNQGIYRGFGRILLPLFVGQF